MRFSVLLSLLYAGCGTSATSPTGAARTDTDGIINTVCPVMGGDVTADITVDWKGKKVAFCCPPCIEEWNELSEDEKEAKLKTASAKPHGATGSSGAH
jgi:hypothetical protein